MTAYLGEFTVRNNGTNLPARIYVGTADMMSSQEPSPLVLSSDPVIITWDECGITDVIHRSQLQLNLIARADGDYRDIMDSLGQIYCRLDIDHGTGYTTWWCGAYASVTWLEPFSREKGYAVQLTFSDFGFLERLDYDGSRFGCTGGVSVASVVSRLASLFTGYVYMPAIVWMPMSSAMMNGNEFSTLLVRDTLFTEDDGTPRNMLDILTDILDPANVHIMQYCGKVYLFRPDGETAGEIGADVSSTLKAASTDAEMESCETYSRAELDFDPAASTQESEVKPDDTPFMYDGYAPLPLSSAGLDVIMTHDDNPSTCRAIVYGAAVEGPLMVLLVKSAFFSWEWHGTPPAAPSTTTSFILYNPGKVRIAVSPDTITPDILKEEHIVSSVLLTLDLWMFMQNPEGRRLGGVRVDSEIRFISMTGDI